ncbi:hypothetical protein RR48_08143 [Papilio machaon]|uniref:Uncharacterized protein n=1 Tax=Papilio machaon TaxID=76193 RepID=A0A194RG32_PAPMA|nr:hypothetical protein RR48_08143 [Papilio machaon]
MGYSQLCDNKTRSCTTQILGHDYTEDSCQLEYFKPDSPACRAMDFAPISPNDHIGGVSLKPYSLQYDHVTPLGTVYTVNHTVLNITFSNIKWKTMKFRFQFSKQKNSDNHCRNIVISNNVTINDQSMFYYDCYWPISDGNPNGQSHILDFEATDDVVVNRGQYYFNIPTPQMLICASWLITLRPESVHNLHDLEATITVLGGVLSLTGVGAAALGALTAAAVRLLLLLRSYFCG